MYIQPVTNYNQKNTTFTHIPKSDEPMTKEKIGTAAMAALGVATSIAMIAKHQNFSLRPSRIAKTPIKDWAIFKIADENNPKMKVLKFEAPQILLMGLGSVLGGLAGGAIFDKKENFGAKCSEAVNQLLGDVSIPLGFVAVPTILYKKFEKLAKTETPHIKLQKASKFITGNKFLRVLCPTVISGTSLATGIIAGNKVSNAINEKVHGIKADRGIRITDFAPHIDDVCLAITLMAENSPIGSIISKFVPIALTVAGIETGKAKPHHTMPKTETATTTTTLEKEQQPQKA